MSSIDERVVEMKFNNKQFEAGIKTTLDSLSALKRGLNLDAARKGFDALTTAGKRFTLDGVTQGIEGVSTKFVALATIGITALSNITTKALYAGGQVVKSLTIDPVKMGLQEYETNLNSIQTILANTSTKGTGLEDVTDGLQELNEYSDKTIYNFAEMARNIGTFTAAGVDLDTSTAAIKGIANLAAVSGSNAQQASGAMYQLSQALAAGRLTLIDWNSVVNAGMGGQVFQDALMETARVHGVAIDQIVSDAGSFRDSLQTEWLTSDILTETLSKFTGDLTAEQLKTMGYTDQQIDGILKMGVTASDAATKVKTMSQLINTLQESVQSGWSQTWQTVFGDFEEAKALFTSVNDVIGGMIGASSDARNAVLSDWKALGGRTSAIEAIKNAFNGVMSVIEPIKKAFRDIFPAATGQQLFEITETVRKFTERLTVSGETADKIGRIFKGVFAAVDIGITVIKELVSTFLGLAGSVVGASGGFLEVGARIGDFVVSVRDALKNGQGLEKFFDGLGAVLQTPIALILGVADAIKELVSNFEGVRESGGASLVTAITNRFEPLREMGEGLVSTFEKVRNVFDKVMDVVKPLASAAGDFISKLASDISSALGTLEFDQILDLVNTGLLGALVLAIKNFLGGGLIDFSSLSDGGLIGSIKDVFGGLTDTLSSMQAQIQVGTLLKIAAAVALLAASVISLSLVDSAALTSALIGITVMFGQMAGMLVAVEKVTSFSGAFKLPAIAVGLILLSGALLLMSAAVRSFASLSLEELARGLGGVAASVILLVGMADILDGKTGSILSASVGMIAIGVAIRVLAGAVKEFAGMSWEELSRGLAGVGATLASLALFAQINKVSKGSLISSVGLLLLAASLKIISGIVNELGTMSVDTLTTGLLAMAAALIIIAGAVALIPNSILITAIGLIGVAAALKILSGVLKTFGGMSWEEIAKGMVVLAGSLLIIAGAMYLMTGAIVGALALIVIAGALSILAPVLISLGQMSWEEIGRGLVALGGALLVVGLAALVLTPVIPMILALALGIALIGVGVLAAGVGLLAFSAGLLALSAASTVGAQAISAMVMAIIALIPAAMAALGQGLVAFANVIAQSGPAFVTAITTVLMSLITAINTVAPAIIDTLFNLIMKLVDTLAKNIPRFVTKGLEMVKGILRGVANNIGGIVTAAIDIVTNFINGISRALPRLVNAGINLIVTFVESLADGIRRNTARMQAAARDLASAIIDGMTGGLFSGASRVINAAAKMAGQALSAAKRALGIASPSKEFTEVGEFSGEGLAIGLEKSGRTVAKASESVANTALSTLKDAMGNAANVMNSDMDLSPVIRPVMDLSGVTAGASRINEMLTPTDIRPTVTANKAAYVASAYSESESSRATTDTSTTAGSGVTFIQNNNSPKALSSADIYRQTRNQLSRIQRR